MALDPASLVWRAQLPFLRHGMLAWAIVACAVLMSIQLVQLASSALQLAVLSPKPQAIVQPASLEPVSDPLPLPVYPQRFSVTRDAIAAALGEGQGAMKIGFAYQKIPEARMVRQTASFATQARWDELGPLLDRLQGIERASYISRIRLSREQADQSLVEAEVQLAIIYLDAPAAKEAQ